MNSAPHSLAIVLALGAVCTPCRAAGTQAWSAPPSLFVAALWLLAIGLAFHALLRYHLNFGDRLGDAHVQLGIERNARVLAERALAETHKALCLLVEQQEGVRDNERRRIARDIHDDLGQNLLALKIELSMLQHATRAADPQLGLRIDIMVRNLDLAIKSLRGIINDLRPLALEAGLRYAMEWQLGEFSRVSGIRHHFRADPAAFDSSDDKALDAMLFRVLQESLSNVARHSQATEVRVFLTREGAELRLAVQDNGVGIARAASGSGLPGMRDRVEAAGGRFTVDSGAGSGCRLVVSVPLARPIAVH
ncbi:MAG: sensor histidine kinase [Telluria sp.]